jgi:hypothetical protein
MRLALKDLQDIEHGTYRVIISSPEQLMKEGGGLREGFSEGALYLQAP